jgi:hypothetical protein
MAAANDVDLLVRALPPMPAPPKLLSSGTYMLAEADGQPFGCGGGTETAAGSDQTNVGEAHIRHFATHADWKGAGYGGCFAAGVKRRQARREVKRFVPLQF